MKIIHLLNKCDLDTSKKVYECHVCNKLFNWNDNSFWYGSLNQLEFNKGNHILHFCSSDCKEKHEKTLNNKKI